MNSSSPNPNVDRAGTVVASGWPGDRAQVPFRLFHAILRGSLGFAVVSLAGFSVWAVGGKWLQAHVGEAGLYAACAGVFLASSGLLLHSLVQGPGSVLRFYTVFVPAFFAYAFIWCAAWFSLRFGLGEWLGSLLGAGAFVGVVAWRFKANRGILFATLVLFALHSAGYFLGGRAMHWAMGPAGSSILPGLSKAGISMIAKLSWGLLYGLGFGAGIGYVFHTCQSRN